MSRRRGTLLATGVAEADVKGGFTINLTTGSCWWSPGMYALHGYSERRTSQVVPSGRLFMAHCDPADWRIIQQARAHLLMDGGMVALRYRTVGADRILRSVFVMASLRSDRDGDVITGVMQLERPGSH